MHSFHINIKQDSFSNLQLRCPPCYPARCHKLVLVVPQRLPDAVIYKGKHCLTDGLPELFAQKSN